jgi:hypothetical protein
MKRLTSALRALSAKGCTPMLVLTAACLLVKEQYPLSDFPMYSSFTSKTFYVYLADGDGTPIATAPATGMTTPTLKKIYVSETRRERARSPLRSQGLTSEQKRAAGERLLTQLKNSPDLRERNVTLPVTLRLYEVNISMAHGRFDKQTELVAELR